MLDAVSPAIASPVAFVSAAMTKCSRWLSGHDDSPAGRAEIIEPEEVKDDIEQLYEFISTIRKRRR